jgi:hypothetical protein
LPALAFVSAKVAAATLSWRTDSVPSTVLTLGPAVKEAFPDIRKQALDLLAQVRLGNDPAEAKKAAVAAAKRQQAESFKAIVDIYLARQLKTPRPRTYQEEERYLLVKAKPLHSRPIATITRRDIAC